MEVSEQIIDELYSRARWIRRTTLEMITHAGSGHPGGALSCVEILACLYFRVLRIDPDNPRWPGRDRFILSKGHSCPALYATLAARGFMKADELMTLRAIGGRLQGHPDMKKTPGVDMTSGSLGQGLSAGLGMALAGKLDQAAYRVYVLLGDGEIQEGQVWEAAMAAAHFKLDNLTAIVDYNKVQLDGPVRQILDLGDIEAKWRAFGWEVFRVDGHEIKALLSAMGSAQLVKNQPSVIIADTVKGKGVSFMEGKHEWHGRAPNQEQLEAALRELDGQ